MPNSAGEQDAHNIIVRALVYSYRCSPLAHSNHRQRSISLWSLRPDLWVPYNIEKVMIKVEYCVTAFRSAVQYRSIIIRRLQHVSCRLCCHQFGVGIACLPMQILHALHDSVLTWISSLCGWWWYVLWPILVLVLLSIHVFSFVCHERIFLVWWIGVHIFNTWCP